ncbi:hypothetical protein NBRC116598_37770 [Pseudophaeobacter arcticus]|uniref:Uncharacterized protein n=1 Tax=Pseudophaeobacter arcticus TaxID=385492 RepID=A0ABQ0AR34_9RHOB
MAYFDYTEASHEKAVQDLQALLERTTNEATIVDAFAKDYSVFHSSRNDGVEVRYLIKPRESPENRKRARDVGVEQIRNAYRRAQKIICGQQVSERIAKAKEKGRAELYSAVIDGILLALSGPTVVTIAAIIIVRGHEHFCSSNEYIEPSNHDPEMLVDVTKEQNSNSTSSRLRRRLKLWDEDEN